MFQTWKLKWKHTIFSRFCKYANTISHNKRMWWVLSLTTCACLIKCWDGPSVCVTTEGLGVLVGWAWTPYKRHSREMALCWPSLVGIRSCLGGHGVGSGDWSWPLHTPTDTNAHAATPSPFSLLCVTFVCVCMCKIKFPCLLMPTVAGLKE